MNISTIPTLSQIDAANWNRLNKTNNPFLRHEFLYALETHQCVGEQWGWIPQYLILKENDQLIGAAPMYLKTNSYGEFVFDWSWASAYERLGLNYYPKLVMAVPYTPIKGARLMLADESKRGHITRLVSDWIKQYCHENDISSMHVLFPEAEEIIALEQHNYLRRMDCQFHWFNQDYKNFDHFLSQLSSQKRKKIKRERRRVTESNISIQTLSGTEANEDQWLAFFHFYCDTFDRRGGYPTLSLDFFLDISRSMGDNIVLMLAEYQQRIVAGALCLRNEQALFGRHWGCSAEFHSLHFELCYYQGIEYCINQGLHSFEPGAQGEHKISRGFIPVPTLSAHWIKDPRFNHLIDDFLRHELKSMANYINELHRHAPYKIPLVPAGADSAITR